MKSFFKTILIIGGIVVGLIFFMFASIGVGIFGLASSVVDAANHEVTQTIVVQGDKIRIEVPLEKNMVLRYDNLKECAEEERDMFSEKVDFGNDEYHSTSWSCFNDNCHLTVSIDDLSNVPEYLSFKVENEEGVCEKKKYPTKENITVGSYSSTIEFTDELKNSLGLALDDDSYKVEIGKSSETMVYQVMGTKKISFSYATPMKEDVLVINNREKMKIVLKYVGAREI